jgi:hypothetical protein
VLFHDHTGISPTWHCSLVAIRDTSVNLTTYFYCDRWLDAKCMWRVLLKPSWRTPLPEGICRYVVTVKTSDVLYAGTDSNVHMQLCGAMDEVDHAGVHAIKEVETARVPLNNSKDNFEVGAVQVERS